MVRGRLIYWCEACPTDIRLRASKTMQERIFNHSQIHIHWHSSSISVDGDRWKLRGGYQRCDRLFLSLPKKYFLSQLQGDKYARNFFY
jgi:thioredoxin reductase